MAMGSLEQWEAGLVLNLRRWCEGPHGQAQVWNAYARSFGAMGARDELRVFEALLNALISNASRPLVRHSVDCSCVGSDECVFLNLVRTAADGYLNDAALISTLLAGPAHAEAIACLAGQVGESARRASVPIEMQNTDTSSNVVTLH